MRHGLLFAHASAIAAKASEEGIVYLQIAKYIIGHLAELLLHYYGRAHYYGVRLFLFEGQGS